MKNSQKTDKEVHGGIQEENQQEKQVDTNVKERKLEFGIASIKNLNATRKWTMFLSVVGFIFLGLIIFMGLATSTFLSAFETKEVSLGIPESLVTVFFLAVVAVYFFPVFFLLRFSSFSRDAVQELDRNKLDKAFKNLRIFFTYIGILVLIALTIYLSVLIAAGSSVALLNGV